MHCSEGLLFRSLIIVILMSDPYLEVQSIPLDVTVLLSCDHQFPFTKYGIVYMFMCDPQGDHFGVVTYQLGQQWQEFVVFYIAPIIILCYYYFFL